MSTQIPIPIPTLVIQNITNYISVNYPTLSENNKTKLFSRVCELWFTIYTEHQHEIQKKSKDFHNSHIDNIYVDIPKTRLAKFQIKIAGTNIQYPTILGILKSTNLIHINDAYSTNRFSKSYRPNPEIKYDLIQNIELDLQKFTKNFKTREQLLEENPTYTKLISDLYLIKVDLSQFFKTLESLIGLPYKTEKGQEIILTPQHAYSLKIRAIKTNLGIHFFSVASTGRLYTSLSNLPKLTLKHITLNNKPTVEIDAANCQPLLLASLINHPQFTQDCEAGIFYNKMANHLGITREEFKIQSYAQIFFNNKKITKTMATQLDSVYPGLSTLINQYKCKSKKEAQTKHKSELLWHQLQSLESQIFIGTALSQLAPVITRHDSIICNQEVEEEIRNTLIKKFSKIGIKVTLK